MSSEPHKHIKISEEKKLNLLNAQIINFPNKKNKDKNKKLESEFFWEILDKSNNDQFKAVTGICFMLGALVLMGLYSNFL